MRFPQLARLAGALLFFLFCFLYYVVDSFQLRLFVSVCKGRIENLPAEAALGSGRRDHLPQMGRATIHVGSPRPRTDTALGRVKRVGLATQPLLLDRWRGDP